RAEDGKLYIIPNKEVESKVWIVEGRPAESASATPTFRIPSFFSRKRGDAPAQPGGAPQQPGTDAPRTK
ncbi:MAG TPA: hypothetical protein VMT34_09750, partial [Aggregatilineales bacterium]|nr:hypothetical protein [Aggregatilineales bacterium]